MRTIWRTCSASVLAVVLPLAACQRAAEPVRAPAGPPPTLWALVLEVRDTSVSLKSFTPTRGMVVAPSLDERLDSIRSGAVTWIEYVLHAKREGPALGTGAFIVSRRGIAESAISNDGGAVVTTVAPVVTVGVPYSAELSTISFVRAEPSASDPREWKRVSLGIVSLAQGAK